MLLSDISSLTSLGLDNGMTRTWGVKSPLVCWITEGHHCQWVFVWLGIVPHHTIILVVPEFQAWTQMLGQACEGLDRGRV